MATKILRRSKNSESLETEGKNPPNAGMVTIDHPGKNEKINPGHYAVRISADPDVVVELSINGGEWAACRYSSGYYWFDWVPGEAGSYELTARAHANNSKPKKSECRECEVSLGSN